MTKLLRTLRLDLSDTFVFERAAEPGQWAVPGSFVFWDASLETMSPKSRAAFRSGFLDLGTFAHATLVEVADISAAERDRVVDALADHLVTRYGAPDRETARAAALDEIAFAASLCDHEAGTVIAMHRTVERGEIKEQFRTLRSRDPGMKGADRLHAQARAFEFVETDEPEEQVDLLGLMGKS
jgi:Family of unknown function (DUF6505)